MALTRYFKPGQKVLMERLPEGGPAAARFEALTVILEEVGDRYLDLSLPYARVDRSIYPFEPEMRFELRSISLGMGLRVSGAFREWLGENRIRISCDLDFRAFQNRPGPRIDVRMGLRFSRGSGHLGALREQWEKNVALLHSGRDLKGLKDFIPCEVNLSAGGMRFTSMTAMQMADVCQVLLELPDGGSPVSALAEVVWLLQEEGEPLTTTGMQFLALDGSDRARIEQLVKRTLREAARKTKAEG